MHQQTQTTTSSGQHQRCKPILCRQKRPQVTKTVSFCRDEECRIYKADDYDRTAVAPSRDLSTRDYQELEEVLSFPHEHNRQRIVGGRIPIAVVPLLQDDAPKSPPTSPTQPGKFPSTPSRFTSFNFLPVNPQSSDSEASQRVPSPPPASRAPARSFPGFAFMSVVPVTDPPPPPPPVPQSRPTNFLPLTPVTSTPANPTPTSSVPSAPLSVSFKRGQPQQHAPDAVTRPRAAGVPSSSSTGPMSIPSAASSTSSSTYRSWNSQPNTSSPGRREFRPSSSPPYCAPISSGCPQSPPPSLLRTFAS
ncbi:hypothetical protein EXIGLDRAFT_763275 [Exidia glandulosa HHB12029]|uniref:Uncharacterized protein n=1 Tax=Exidia glandulosa HHB12029 TaxID=1314781 RepID=A0A165M5W4_EXIGL|nr:hypothetical protein EXIGLDRAFT_763275 [Exidia glandulosa HHB12029]